MKIITSKYGIALLMIVMLFLGCRREEANSGAKPFVKTNNVLVNTQPDVGITLSGEFVFPSVYSSISYGFYLSPDESFRNSVIIQAGTDNAPGKFEVTAQVALAPDVKYYVKTWAKTDKYEVLGNVIEFSSSGSPAPVIATVMPDNAFWGDTVMITGKYFDYFGKDNKVLFNDLSSPKVWGNRDTIWAVVPVVKDSDLKVYVEVNKRSEIGVFFQLLIPVISGITKTEGQYPDTITISGDNFSVYNTSILVDGKETPMFDVKRKTISFIVPYLKSDRSVKVELTRFSKSYPVTDNFHYLGQSILECSPNSAWIGDTIKLYAKNIDFRRVELDVKNVDQRLYTYEQSLIITRKWKDSLAFILTGHPDASNFNLDIQFGKKSLEWPYKSFTSVDQKIVNHRPPVLASIENVEYVYGEPINYDAKGMYWGAENQSILIKSIDGSVNLSFQYFSDFSSNELIYPGDYQMQLSSFDRFSNIKYFTVNAPIIQGVSPLVISRHDEVQITGENLPYGYAYKLTQIESGRSFLLQNWWEQNPSKTSQQVLGEGIIGSGNYQFELSIGNKSYKYPGIIEVKDYFKYFKRLTDSFWQTSSIGCGFAMNNKLYIPQQSGEMSIVDLETGNVRKKQGYYNYDHQPVFLNDKIYMNVYLSGKYVLSSFNETTEDWDAMNMDGVSTDFSLKGFGTFNNQLLVISQNGDLYQYNQKWIFLSNVKTNYYFVHYIHSANGNLYLCDFYMGKIAVVSTTDWKIIKEISMPGHYENSLRYVFEIQGEMFFCAKPTGEGDYYSDLYKFTTEETFEALNPKSIKFDFYNHFCPDGKGNVFFVNEGYVYKFNP